MTTKEIFQEAEAYAKKMKEAEEQFNKYFKGGTPGYVAARRIANRKIRYRRASGQVRQAEHELLQYVRTLP